MDPMQQMQQMSPQTQALLMALMGQSRRSSTAAIGRYTQSTQQMPGGLADMGVSPLQGSS